MPASFTAYLTAALPASGLFRARMMTADSAIVLLTVGVCLIFLELNRPGRILPGALGLLLTLLAFASLHGLPFHDAAVVSLVASALMLLLNLWVRLPWALLVLATAGLCVGFRFLVQDPVHIWVALPCGLVLGGAGATLSRIALRARRAKQIN